MATQPLHSRRRALHVAARGAIWCAAALLAAGAARAQEDVLHLRRADGAEGRAILRGKILDYTGGEVKIELAGPRVQTFAAERVIEIERQRGSAEKSGDEHFAQHDYAAAIADYTQALESEERAWVRRQLLARLVEAHRESGDVIRAGRLFLSLVASDPGTSYFHLIPLAWQPVRPDQETIAYAARWFDDDRHPAAVLLGASYLLGTDRAAEALVRLRRLSVGDRRAIACLAEAQIWRRRHAEATDTQVDDWASTIEKYPESLRAGPYYVLGRVLAQRRQSSEAALALLHVPILYPEQRTLAALALVEAGDALRRIGQEDEAKRLYRDVEKEYPQTSAAKRLRQRVDLSAEP